MAHETDGIVQILDDDGKHVGMGIVVDHKCVITCAHVVNMAWGQAAYSPAPPPAARSFRIRFCFSSVRECKGRIKKWGLASGDSRSESVDLALLELEKDKPVDVRAGEFTFDECQGMSWKVYGQHVPNERAPNWTTLAGAKISSPTLGAHVQLDGVSGAGRWIDHGDSGGAVWCPELEGIVGIVATKHMESAETRISTMIPADVVLRFHPYLHRRKVPPKIVDLPHYWVDRGEQMLALKRVVGESNRGIVVCAAGGFAGARFDAFLTRLAAEGLEVASASEPPWFGRVEEASLEVAARQLDAEQFRRLVEQQLSDRFRADLRELLAGSRFSRRILLVRWELDSDRVAESLRLLAAWRDEHGPSSKSDRRLIWLVNFETRRPSWLNFAAFFSPRSSTSILDQLSDLKGQFDSLPEFSDIETRELSDWRKYIEACIEKRVLDRLSSDKLEEIVPPRSRRPMEHVLAQLEEVISHSASRR
ncbi:MAG: hypothetical protein U1A77_25790 [Pirellulales bacterium]